MGKNEIYIISQECWCETKPSSHAALLDLRLFLSCAPVSVVADMLTRSGWCGQLLDIGKL